MSRKAGSIRVRSELAVPLMAVVVGLLFGALAMILTGTNPIRAYAALIRGCFGSRADLSETSVYVTPLIFTGLSIAVAYKAGLFNIGAEGQLIVGMVASAIVGVAGAGLPRIIHLPLTLASGMLAGALWAFVPGILKAKFGVHEVVNSIMMNYIALYLSHYLVTGPIKDPNIAAPYSREIANTAKLTRFFGGFGSSYRFNSGLLIAIAAALLVYYILYRTTLGYEIRAVGHNPDAARYAGISVARSVTLSMMLAGGMSGLAGAVQVCGIQQVPGPLRLRRVRLRRDSCGPGGKGASSGGAGVCVAFRHTPERVADDAGHSARAEAGGRHRPGGGGLHGGRRRPDRRLASHSVLSKAFGHRAGKEEDVR